LRLPLDSLQNFKKTREICCRQSLFEDLPALDDYDEKSKKRYGTISKLFQAAKSFIQRETRKERGKKDETLFEVHLLRQCIEERDGMLYVFYRQQII
jgi:hypothetical protein